MWCVMSCHAVRINAHHIAGAPVCAAQVNTVIHIVCHVIAVLVAFVAYKRATISIGSSATVKQHLSASRHTALLLIACTLLIVTHVFLFVLFLFFFRLWEQLCRQSRQAKRLSEACGVTHHASQLSHPWQHSRGAPHPLAEPTSSRLPKSTQGAASPVRASRCRLCPCA